jgi:dTDP-4-dehydrorhamnose 3,5-epimerase
LNVIETAIPSVLIMEPKLFGHDRRCLFELYHAGRCAVSGIPEHFVQHNLARSAKASCVASISQNRSRSESW